MLRLGKVAAPFVAATVRVPESVPADGFVPIATVMELVAMVTTLPRESSMLTITAGEIGLPGMTLVGGPVKASLEAAPADTLKAELVAPVKLVALAVRV